LDPLTNTYTDIIDFSGSGTDAGYPYGSLTYDANKGVFYGMAQGGGTYNRGVIFTFNPSTNKDSLLYNFDGTTGSYPYGDITIDPSDSILYGVTEQGGTNGAGVIFSFNIKRGKDSVLHNFKNDSTGSYPYGSMLLINTKAPVTITKDTTICKGSNVTLMANAGGGSNYTWSTGAITSSISVNPALDSTYKVHVCRGIFSRDTTVKVTVNPTPTVTIISGKDTIILGSIDTLVATGGLSYVWTSGSTKDSTFVSPASTTTYTVTGKNASGCTDAVSMRVVVKVITGINTLASGNTSVYPNPATEIMYLSFTMPGSADAVIEVMNINGEVVMSKQTTISNGQVMPIDISTLANGVYFAHITTGEQTQVVRFVKE
ncbi:MAG TPA: choice-of-anchor tandem repeat GloVer-containing protein, partial [Bacteroidia bacterium]|nr:choice-of-anchor tandem repeat GloVer-containing protein [Bacteroidia bacterium]